MTRRLDFENIRSLLLSYLPEPVRARIPHDSANDEAISYAFYAYLRTVLDLDVTIDGWSVFQVAEESAASIRGVGIMTLLPGGELPMEVTLSRESDASHHQVRLGLEDDDWTGLSESKRWKAVYFYATEGRIPPWTWCQPISGFDPAS